MWNEIENHTETSLGGFTKSQSMLSLVIYEGLKCKLMSKCNIWPDTEFDSAATRYWVHKPHHSNESAADANGPFTRFVVDTGFLLKILNVACWYLNDDVVLQRFYKSGCFELIKNYLR